MATAHPNEPTTWEVVTYECVGGDIVDGFDFKLVPTGRVYRIDDWSDTAAVLNTLRDSEFPTFAADDPELSVDVEEHTMYIMHLDYLLCELRRTNTC